MLSEKTLATSFPNWNKTNAAQNLIHPEEGPTYDPEVQWFKYPIQEKKRVGKNPSKPNGFHHKRMQNETSRLWLWQAWGTQVQRWGVPGEEV